MFDDLAYYYIHSIYNFLKILLNKHNTQILFSTKSTYKNDILKKIWIGLGSRCIAYPQQNWLKKSEERKIHLTCLTTWIRLSEIIIFYTVVHTVINGKTSAVLLSILKIKTFGVVLYVFVLLALFGDTGRLPVFFRCSVSSCSHDLLLCIFRFPCMKTTNFLKTIW